MALIFIIFVVAQADRANIGFAIPYIQDEFKLSNTDIGVIISLFFAGYALCQIPSGYLVRKKRCAIFLCFRDGADLNFYFFLWEESTLSSFLKFYGRWLASVKPRS
ncbi:MFS transporter [Klebsiella quasipneumoniae]|nr:MFS transporter [Klebsiella quasipneumoniae]